MDKKRELGVAAKNQQAANLGRTWDDFKQRLGENRNQDKTLSIEQITAMFLSKLKADAMFVVNVLGCVIAVPSYFTPSQNKALLIAAGAAELNCHNLIRETTAIAINYGIYKKFPTPINVFFADFGHSSLQIFACHFSESGIEILAEKFALIGGRDIDKKLENHFLKQLKNEIDENFHFALREESERLKHKMSVNTTEMPLNIQNFLKDDIMQLSLQRSEMEEICSSSFDQIKKLLKECLEESKLNSDQIHSIEIVGGSSRIPKFKTLIKEVFGKHPLETMNQDEAVSRGCVLSSFLPRKRRNFVVKDKPLLGEKEALDESSSNKFMKVVEVCKPLTFQCFQICIGYFRCTKTSK